MSATSATSIPCETVTTPRAKEGLAFCQLYRLAGRILLPGNGIGGDRDDLKEMIEDAVAAARVTGDPALERTAVDLMAGYEPPRRLDLQGGSSETSPYSSLYGAKTSFQETQNMADVAGFYRAFGLHPAGAERPDHIGLECEFMGWLSFKEALAAERGEVEGEAVVSEAIRRFLGDHLGPCAFAFADGLDRSRPPYPYSRFTPLLRAVLIRDFGRRGLPLPGPAAARSMAEGMDYGEMACADSEGGAS